MARLVREKVASRYVSAVVWYFEEYDFSRGRRKKVPAKLIWIEVWPKKNKKTRRVSENDLRWLLQCKVAIIKSYIVGRKELLLVAVPEDAKLPPSIDTGRRYYKIYRG